MDISDSRQVAQKRSAVLPSLSNRYTEGMQKSIPSVKTAISLKKPLYQQIDKLAREMKLPRSRVFVLALEDYLERHQNRMLLNAINEAYAGEVNVSDAKRVAGQRRSHRKIVEGEW